MTWQNKEFLQKYHQLLNTPEGRKEFIQRVYRELTGIVVREELFDEILPEADIDLSTERWEYFDSELLKLLDEAENSMWKNKSNDHGRLRQLLFANLPFDDIDYEDIVNHLEENKDKLGIKMEPLEQIYSYDNWPDYDLLGKFDKAAYERENPDLF